MSAEALGRRFPGARGGPDRTRAHAASRRSGRRRRAGAGTPCWGRGVITECSRRGRAQARAARRRRRGPLSAEGGGVGRSGAGRGLEGRQKGPRLLTQPGLQALPFRLRHIAAARAGPAASNLARTCERGAGAGPAWGPERREPALLGSLRTAADNETPNVSFWLLPFDLGLRDSQRPDECSVAQI